MADTTFSDAAGTPIVATWLNDVNRLIYDIPKTDTSAHGSGLVGYSDAANYTSGTIGNAVQQSLDTYTVSGTNTLTVTARAFPTSYITGTTIKIKLAATNTGPVTLNVNSLGAKTIVDQNGLNLAPGALTVGMSTSLVYNGTNFVLQSSTAYSLVRKGPRTVVQYASATSVKVRESNVQMAGFRFMGSYTKTYAPTYPTSAFTSTVSTSTNLGAESSVAVENWYAIFACANDGDSAVTFKIMPYLRAGSVAGSVVTLNKAGEGISTVVAKTYAWNSTNNLANVDCLVISEAGSYSGRVTTITANTGTTVTLNSIGSVAAFDFILPAPPGYSQYCYLGSFYFDTAEVRNIYDTGTITKSKMIYILAPTINGAQAAPGTQMNAAGYICPLATGVIIDSSCTLSTASAGDYAEYFDPDGGGHIVQSFYIYKDNTSNMSVQFTNAQVPFLYHQKFNYANAGSLNATRISGQLNITGWIEL